jgi:hypothetical protein
MFDILLNFSIAFYEYGELVVNRYEIIHHYLRGWFPLDVFSSFPYSWLVEARYGIDSRSNPSVRR